MRIAAASSWIDRLVVAGLTCLGVVITWRAATQAVTYDEAVTWLTVLRGPLHEVLTTSFSANNHVLFSLCAWLTTHAFGVSELTLRFPSVLAGWASLFIIRGLAHTIAGPAAAYPLLAAALALNPFLLDFMVAARGYSMATAAFLFAVLRVLRTPDLTRAAGRDRIVIGLALGVSVAANLAFAFPAVALIAVCGCLVTFSGRADHRHGARTVLWLATAAAAVATPVLTLPLLKAQPNIFFYGSSSFFEASRSLVAASLQHDAGSHGAASNVVVDAVAGLIIPLALATWTAAFGLWIARSLRRNGRGPTEPADFWPVVVIGGISSLTIAGLAIGHLAFGVLLPLERTGLYWLPVFVLGLGASARATARAAGFLRAGRGVSLLLLAALAAAFVAQFTTTHFRTWRFDAGSRDLFALVESWPCPADRTRRVTTTAWLYEPAIEFYRVTRGADHVRPLNVERESYTPGDADFYVIQSAEDAAALAAVATTVAVHPVSGASLLVDNRLTQCEGPRASR